MNIKEFTSKIPKDSKEQHKDALVHLLAFHTGNKPDAIRNSLEQNDGFAKSKIKKLKPEVLSEVYKSTLMHAKLKGKQ